jgi:hypothetical protein
METAQVSARLAAAAERCTELAEQLAAEQERRNQLVIEARDEGMPWRSIARAARLSPSRVVSIVATG